MVAIGDKILASDVNDWRPIPAVKPTATSRNTTVTPTADTDFNLSLLTNSTYEVKYCLFVSSTNASGDFRFNLSWTGSATVSMSGLSVVGGIASGGSADVIASPCTRLDAATPTLDFLTGASAAGIFVSVVARVVTTSAVVLTLNWAQRVSNAANTTLLEGSFCSAQKVL